MTTFKHGRYSLEWEDIGEGYCGDYDENDPEDKPLLRATLSGDGESLNSGSYCTLIPADTSKERLCAASNLLFRQLPDDPSDFRRSVMEKWTWTEVDDL